MPALSDLQAIVGSENAAESSRLIRVSPGSTDEVAAVLRSCNENGVAVTPSGGGTKLSWGNPVQSTVRLSLERLTGVREHVWQDMTATVGAGTRWADMQAVFARHGQQVALDPLFPTQATVGGVLAVNDSNALRMKYGSLRDLVIGATVVLADGTVARSGGKVVKNVAGYDLPKLLIGSFGTLGVITEVNFRLHPQEQKAQTWTIQGEIEMLGDLMQRLRQSASTLQSLQFRSDGGDVALDARFASSDAALQNDAAKFRSMCVGSQPEQSSDEVWDWRQGLFAEQQAAVIKITSLPTQLSAIIDGFTKCGVHARCAAEAVGITTVQVNGEPDFVLEIIEDLRARLGASGGMLVVLQWPFNDVEVDRWGGSTPAIAVMRELKQQFDPKRVLNPGKFVGGI